MFLKLQSISALPGSRRDVRSDVLAADNGLSPLQTTVLNRYSQSKIQRERERERERERRGRGGGRGGPRRLRSADLMPRVASISVLTAVREVPDTAATSVSEFEPMRVTF